MMASQYSNSEKGSKNESSEDKTRSRSVSTALVLICVAVASTPVKTIPPHPPLNLIIVLSVRTALLLLLSFFFI